MLVGLMVSGLVVNSKETGLTQCRHM